jgi:hypothetical protein
VPVCPNAAVLRGPKPIPKSAALEQVLGCQWLLCHFDRRSFPVRRSRARNLITAGWAIPSALLSTAAAATNYLPLVMNYITATAINRGTPTANLRSSVTERAMMNKAENRELPMATITAWVMLFFGSVSLSISYFAIHTGLLAG